MVNCKVCEKEESKYKCPICIVPYCSLICYKEHKELPCERPTTSETIEQQQRKEITPTSAPDDEDPSRLTPQDLEKLAYSNQIHRFLEHPQLREIIAKLDTSSQPEKDLDSIRDQDPVFDDFTKLLVDITFKDKLAAFQQKK